MSTRNFGLSNIYLKIAVSFLVLSVVAVVAALATPSLLGTLAGQLTGFFVLAGALLYVIGRIVQITRSRKQA
jgi:membrane protein implicated in regulation of membrane protease activity